MSPTDGTATGDVPAPTASYHDTTVSGGHTYSSAVFAHGAADDYAVAATVAVTTPVIPCVVSVSAPVTTVSPGHAFTVDEVTRDLRPAKR